ncbi:DUF177 domain-containing protein [candidate division KSB1 bacterium]|nr:DUF177 domain-containing protein [candidate division KSB1 bacterium]
MFKIKLSTIKEGASSLSRRVSPSDLRLHDSEFFTQPIDVELLFERVGRNVFVDVRLESPVDFLCDRCSEPFTALLKEQVRLLYSTDRELQDQEDDLVYVVSENEQDVDLADTLRETLILALPVKRLCTPDCRGLCPHCGANLNLTTCDCKSPTADPRWDKLNDLFKSN